MSQVNFDNLISEHPENTRALRFLQAWLNEYHKKSIYLDELVNDVCVDSVELADALTLLVQAGVLRRVYKVIDPDGVYADGEFDDPTKIPPKLPNRWEHYFDTAESDVVPVFEMVA